jgi:hypothetical protein
MKKTMLVPLFGVFFGALAAQTTIPVSDTLKINSIQARVQSSGALFLGGSDGHFLVPAATGSANSLSLMKSAGLWLGGRDSAGVLHLSAQLYNDNGKSDFYPGWLDNAGLPDNTFNFIADVTGADVDAHLANPAAVTPAVYAWPGNGNPYFFGYYGFELPFSYYLTGFNDAAGDGSYNPPGGDYPAVEIRACPLKFGVDELMWFAFHDVGPHTQSGALPLGMQVNTQVFGFSCPEGSPLDRVVYVAYKLINQSKIPLDSCYFGVFMDFEIGNGNDDFIGCDTARRVVFAYNGDGTDEGGFENTPPVMAVDLLRGPFNSDFTGEADWHFVPVDDTQLLEAEDYYQLLSGRQTDGVPFPNNGIMYAGDPLDPSAWSETSADNAPGERKALTSFGPFNLSPGSVSEIVLAYTWVRRDPDGNVAENLSILGATMDEVQEAFDYCFELFEGCPGNVATGSPAAPASVSISPNPFSGWLTVQSDDGTPLESLDLYDATGRLIRRIEAAGATTATIREAGLRPGLYLLRVGTRDGRTASFKVVNE